jgi:xylulokinase
MTRDNMTTQNLARAAVEGMLCGLADAVDEVVRHSTELRRVLLIGGGARSAAVQTILPSLLGVPVVLPEPAEYVACGAALQAAWALGRGDRPDWPVPGRVIQPDQLGASVRAAYAEARGAFVASRS